MNAGRTWQLVALADQVALTANDVHGPAMGRS